MATQEKQLSEEMDTQVKASKQADIENNITLDGCAKKQDYFHWLMVARDTVGTVTVDVYETTRAERNQTVNKFCIHSIPYLASCLEVQWCIPNGTTTNYGRIGSIFEINFFFLHEHQILESVYIKIRDPLWCRQKKFSP